jgi:peptide/nickel transport system ATP-binding protein
MTADALVEIEDLSLAFATPAGPLKVLRGISLAIGRRRILGLVGESGSGKSTLALALLGLLPGNTTALSGRIDFAGEDILALPEDEARRRRGARIAMIFQDPMTSLNPVFTLATQLVDAQRNRHPRLSRRELRQRAQAMLERVGIADAARRLDAYPHQLSGGMRQRVMIAMALLCEPELLIADEPTTALDVTIEAQIVDLLKELQAGFEGSVVLVSHSLGLISELADEVAVMYAGKVVEIAATRELFNRPSHPYTQALLACEIDPRQPPGGRLATIKGSLPDLIEVPQGCIFAPRCPKRFARCVEEPPLRAAGEGHRAACWLAGEA